MTKKVLCPIDGTDHSLHALETAAEIATKFGAELSLCLVNVAHGGRGALVHHWSDAEAAEILDKASKLAARHGHDGVHSATIIHRDPASGILDYADSSGADHIVMGTGNRRGRSRLMRGSVAADVAGRAHCTVTIAR